MEFRAIILRIIWRLAPALWLDWAIRRLIDWAITTLNDQQDWLNAHPRNCHWFGGWLAVIEARLDELIDLKAHLLLNRRCDPRTVPGHHPPPGVRSIDDCLLRLARLVQRFEDADRLAERRAETLLRLHDDSVTDLIRDHRPAISSSSSSSRNSIATGAAASQRTAASSCSSSSSSSRSNSETGAAGSYYAAPIRGPPSSPDCLLPNADCLRRNASETAIPCPKRKEPSPQRYRHSLRPPSTM